MSTISEQISMMKSYTEYTKAGEEHVTGLASTELTSTEFLDLMMKQYEYQDPMEPMDNSDMVSQQCQFSQLQTTQEMSENIASSNAVSQALSLVGKGVVLSNPDNPTEYISGMVDAAYIDGANSCITVDGKDYPLKYLQYAYDVDKTTVN